MTSSLLCSTWGEKRLRAGSIDALELLRISTAEGGIKGSWLAVRTLIFDLLLEWASGERGWSLLWVSRVRCWKGQEEAAAHRVMFCAGKLEWRLASCVWCQNSKKNDFGCPGFIWDVFTLIVSFKIFLWIPPWMFDCAGVSMTIIQILVLGGKSRCVYILLTQCVPAGILQTRLAEHTFSLAFFFFLKSRKFQSALYHLLTSYIYAKGRIYVTWCTLLPFPTTQQMMAEGSHYMGRQHFRNKPGEEQSYPSLCSRNWCCFTGGDNAGLISANKCCR